VGECGRVRARLGGHDGDVFDEILGVAEGALGLEAFLVVTASAPAGRDYLLR
jgi:hypothetical protein